MTWAKVSDTFNDDPALLQLPRGVRLLYVELTVWACKQETDGRVPAYVPPRITDEQDVPGALVALVGTGLLEPVDDGGWQLTRFDDEQRSRAELKAARDVAAAKQQRYRTRKMRHAAGDHTLCDARFCSVALPGNATGDSPGQLPTPDLPVLPVLTEGKDRTGTGQRTTRAAGRRLSADATAAALAAGQADRAEQARYFAAVSIEDDPDGEDAEPGEASRGQLL